MKTVRILDATQLKNKPGAANGHSWQGCLAGCEKLTLWKPTTTVAEIRAMWIGGQVMAHVEPGVDAAMGTKQERSLALSVIGRITQEAKATVPNVTVKWYCPPVLRAGFGGKAAMKEWDQAAADLVTMGFPGAGVESVLIDLYDFESLKRLWPTRAKHAMGQWTSKGIKAVPILYLRMKDTGRLYTDAEARERVALAASLSSTGEVAVFDIKPDGKPDDYRTSPVGRMVEAIAQEGTKQ